MTLNYADPLYQQQLFVAKLTEVELIDGIFNYAWTEQTFDSKTGQLKDADSPKKGTLTPLKQPAVELNNRDIDVPIFVWLRLRGIYHAQPLYEFEGNNTENLKGSSSSCFSQEVVVQVMCDGGGLVTKTLYMNIPPHLGITFTDGPCGGS